MLTVMVSLRKPDSDRRGGFTAVELLAATTLAALLMVAVLGVLQGMTQGQKSLRARETAPAWQARLAAQLEWDFAQAQAIATSADGIALTGLGGRDARSGVVAHRPTQVRYFIAPAGERSCLLREESWLQSRALSNSTCELVVIGVERLVIGLPPDAATTQPESTVTNAPLAIPDGLLPRQLRVALQGSGGQTVFARDFTLR